MTRQIRKYRLRILCEDNVHYYFIRGFLGKLGAIIDRGNRDLVAPLPEGIGGSAEQFVRERFPDALQKYARTRENVILVVAQDVDKPYRDYPSKMKEILEDTTDSDKLLLFFPKKNMETWFKWLIEDDAGRREVNEIDDYKLNQKNAKPASLGKWQERCICDAKAYSLRIVAYYIRWNLLIRT